MDVTDILVFNYCILVSVDTKKRSFVWYTSKHGVAHNPMLHSWHLNFVLVSLFFGRTRKALNFLHCTSQCLLCQVILVGLWMELVFHVLRSKHLMV